MRILKTVLLAAFFLLPLVLPAQSRRNGRDSGQEDSLVRLISADSLQLVEIRGVSYRKVVGRPARFLHNDTYLLCDSALWNVDTKIINAMGNVKIIQERTELKSDKLTYYIDGDLAEFRGTLVQLKDKDNNTLRTKYLDYNTKDSVAVFRNGGSMRDKDGQIIESRTGSYDSKIKTFVFTDDVNMFTDSIFVKTTYLRYESDLSLANFGYNTNAWKDEYMLAANAGWYNREYEKFFFHKNVHLMSDDQESWCDSLYFWRATSDVRMLGNVQITDTTRNVFSLAGRLDYLDSLKKVTLLRDPAVISTTEEKDDYGETQLDTVYFGADTIIYRTLQRWQIDSMEISNARARQDIVGTDPVSTLRKEAAEAAAKAAQEAAENDPNNPAYYEKQKREKEQAEKERIEREKAEAGITGDEGGGNDVKATIDEARILATAKAREEERAARKAAEKAEKKAARELRKAGNVQSDSVVVTARATSAAVSDFVDSLSGAGADTTSFRFSDSLSTHTQDSLAAGTSSPDFPVSDGEQDGWNEPGNYNPDSGEDGDSSAFSDFSDSLAAGRDSTAVADSAALADSLANVPKDTTKFGFLDAYRNVRVFRKSMQIVCDSLSYNDLDSLARLYYEPIVWNEDARHEYVADSIYAVIRNQAMEKANLMSNAFIHIQEDTLHYDQIKSAEMTAFFDGDGQLSRFDALGGSSALFYVEENDALATVNKKDCKMLSARFKDGEIQKIYYFETAKSDAYPVVQMTKEDQTLKGFAWQPEKRPADKNAVTPLSLRPSQRTKYASVPKAKYVQTDIYFPGYISDIYRQIQIRDSLKVVHARERQEAERRRLELESVRIVDSLKRDSLIRAGVLDSLGRDVAVLRDSLERADSLRKAVERDSLITAGVLDSLGRNIADMRDSTARADSLARLDSLAAARRDSLAALPPKALTPEEAKAMKEQEKQAKKQALAAAAAEKKARKEADKARKLEALEAKWAAKDSVYAEKQKKKEAKAQAKLRKKKAKALRAQLKIEAADKAAIEACKEKLLRRQARRQARRKSSGE